MKLYFILILAFACIPDENLPRFAAVYAAMLPITALAYDERSRWDSFAASLPCSKFQLVLSKYLVGMISLTTVTVLTIAARFVYSLFNMMSFDSDFVISTVLSFLVALLIQSILLPFMFKLGVEKGRLFFLIATVVVVLSSISIMDAIGASAMFEGTAVPVLLITFAAMLVIFAISVFLSSKFYKYSK